MPETLIKPSEPIRTDSKPQVFEVEFDVTSLTSAERIFVSNLRLAKVSEGGKTYYMANTPNGRREVILSTISGVAVVGYYQIDEQTGERKIMATTLPGLPKKEITQGTYPESKATYYFPYGRPETERIC